MSAVALVTRAQYAAWWEAYELAGADATEAAIRQDCNTDGDRDDTNGDPNERDIVVDSHEALAVLRHMAASEDEGEAFEQLAGDLARLRTQRQAVLAYVETWEQRAWDRGGDQTVQAIARQLREALGAPR